MRRKLVVSLMLAAILVGACSFDGLGSSGDDEPEPIEGVELEQSERPPPRSPIAEVVEDVLPSVVNVKVEGFGGQGEGSGVVIDAKGIILTNSHVVAGSTDVSIVFTDGKEVEGKVLGADPDRDLAVVQVDERGLDAIEIGNSTDLRLGDEVVAVGFPLGLGGPTVTKGIVSGDDRTIEADSGFAGIECLVGLLQTDAAINPGNSGGALVDRAGRLVGINTAAAGQAENIGFAIAIDQAVPVIDEILAEPSSQRAWLGVFSRTLDLGAASDLDIDPDREGAMVVDVVPGSPAADAGLEQGDVIVDVGGSEVSSNRDLTAALTELDPGETVDVSVVHPGDEEESVEVELGERPGSFVQGSGGCDPADRP
ncbi:MAG: S1C family serine protease [Actinomycetota bacterium]